MIKLDAPYATTIQRTNTWGTQTTTTDTLFVSSVRIDFTTGALYATVERGSGSPFVSNMASLEIIVNPDGSFISTDGSWEGSLSSARLLVASLKGQFDQFVLASGAVTGTQIT